MTMWDEFQIFFLYISPNANHDVFQNVAKSIEQPLLSGLQPIIIGDTNFNSGIKNPLSNYLTNDLGLHQIIKETTFEKSQNIIDHIYVRPDLENTIEVDYRFNYYTDHLSFNLTFK